MCGANKRAGLFILDRAGNTCCVIRSRPYIEPSGGGGGGAFLEMIQIPRGQRERSDADLLGTALREFCEETLCANRIVSVLEEPVALYWDDGGKRWSYDIFIAFADDLLYFAFDPGRMRKTDAAFCGGGKTRNYTFFTADISRTADGVRNNLIVMHVSDYLDYMKNCQLVCYGENNYDVLFRHLATYAVDRVLNAFSYGSAPSLKKRVTIMTHRMYGSIRSNGEEYTQTVEKSVYTVCDKNRDMRRRWYRWWRRMGKQPDPTVDG